MAKTRLEIRDEAADILAVIAGIMGIPIAAANNALVLRYGGHLIQSWKYKGTADMQSFLPIPVPVPPSISTTNPVEPVNLSELLAPMEF